MDKLKNFKLDRKEVWVTMLDGVPVHGHKKMACDNKGDISRSFIQALSSWRIYKQYGFESAVDMKNQLMKDGRLKFEKVL